VRLRLIAAAIGTAAITVIPLAGVANASPAKHPAVSATKSSKDDKGPGKSSRDDKKSSKPAKPVAVTAEGTVTAVDAAAGTLTLSVRKGKLVTGKTKSPVTATLTVAVPASARVRLNSRTVTLTGLPVGASVKVDARSAAGVVTATRVEAKFKPAKPVTTPKPAPTTAPTPDGSVSPAPSTTPDDSGSRTPEPEDD